jgi:hypothetical protein
MFERTTNLGSFQDEHSFAVQFIDFERSGGQGVGRGYAQVVAILGTQGLDMVEGVHFTFMHSKTLGGHPTRPPFSRGRTTRLVALLFKFSQCGNQRGLHPRHLCLSKQSSFGT